MSIRIMSAVFARYPSGGNELLLALALADHAHDDGTHIYPRVAELAGKTRLGVRTVQYLLKRMQEAGWLIKCGSGDGGRGRTVVYRINPQWLKGAELAPFVGAGGPDDGSADEGNGSGPGDAESGLHGDDFDQLEGGPAAAVGAPDGPSKAALKGADSAPFIHSKGAIAAAPFDETERVQTAAQKGAIAVAPAKEPSLEPSIHSPLPPHEGVQDFALTPPESSKPRRGTPRPVVETKPKGKAPKPLISLQTYLDDCRAAGVKPIRADDPIFAYCETVGIPVDVLLLHWAEFKRRRIASGKRQKDWPATLRNSVEGNWFGLWWLTPDGACSLTTKGLQAQAFQRSKGAVHA